MKLNRERYSRQIRMNGFGEEAQLALLRSAVLVVGAGGLGCPVLQYLAGMGVGKIGIIDNDVIAESNLHRQTLYSTFDIGKPKVEVAQKYLWALNPEIEVQAFNDRLSVENALSIISQFNVVVDCTDNFSTRYLVNDACVILNKPFVYGAIYNNEGQVSVFNYKGSATYRCLYPKAPEKDAIADCNANGVLGIQTGIIGCYQANEVIKIITGKGEVLTNKLLLLDSQSNLTMTISFQLKQEHTLIKQLDAARYERLCENIRIQEIAPGGLAERLKRGENIQLIDVREHYEQRKSPVKHAIHIPLNDIETRNGEIKKNVPVVVICHYGVRSLKAASSLLRKGFFEVYSLSGGLDRWKMEMKCELA